MILRSDNPPNSPTVIYDGRCSFCLRWVKRLKKWDRQDRLAFLPLQDGKASEISGVPARELAHALYLVYPDGRVLRAAGAVKGALRYTRWGPVAALLGALPGAMWIAERVYARVAANRYIFGCESDTCSIDDRGN